MEGGILWENIPRLVRREITIRDLIDASHVYTREKGKWFKD